MIGIKARLKGKCMAEFKNDFEKRAKAFMADFELAQNKHNVDARPIITTYGPDLQLKDRLATPNPVEEPKFEKV